MIDLPREVTVTTGTRCAGPNVMLQVTTANAEAFPVTVTLDTPYGTKTLDTVEPGKQITLPFNTRLGSMPAGTLEVTLTGIDDGAPVTEVRTVEYAAATC